MNERDDLDRLVGELKDWAPVDMQSTTALEGWLRTVMAPCGQVPSKGAGLTA